MSIGFNLTTKCRSISSFQKLLDVVAGRHDASASHEEDYSELIICRMGMMTFGFETEEGEVVVKGYCQTNLLGAGFHKAAIELADELVDLNGFPFEMMDETDYYEHRDFERMRSEHFYPWLSNVMELCRERKGGEYQMFAICWDYDKYMPQEVEGAVVSPFGRINVERFAEREEREGIAVLAADFFMWNDAERDARFYRNTALSALWEDCYFMPSSRFDEDRAINDFIIRNLEKAAAMDASLPFPKEDYLLLCSLAEKDPIDISALPNYESDYPIGYRKGKVTYRLGNLSFAVPGHFIYFEQEDSRGYYDDDTQDVWHVVRISAYSIPEEDIHYLEEHTGEMITEKFFNNGKCRLYDMGGDESGNDEYVYQCQIITEHQLSIFTISCSGKQEATRFALDFIEKLVASKEEQHDKLLQQIEQWDADNEQQMIVDAILEIPEEERTVELIGLLARAYNNSEEYPKAIECLRSIEEESGEDALWFHRLGYAYYYMNNLEEAQNAFERALELNPDDNASEQYLNFCKNGEYAYDPEVYDEEEVEALDAHIEKYFGASENVFHEIVSPDIHVDIYVIEPTPARNFYTLITVGMGAHLMDVPEELDEYKLKRAEMVIYLPADWDIYNGDEAYYWPLRWLKILARLPIKHDTWLGWGHTVPNGGPFADNTLLSGVMLINPEDVEEGAAICELPNGEEVNFYQVIPVYEEEMNYKIEHGAEGLLDKMADVSSVVDLNRRNTCAD